MFSSLCQTQASYSLKTFREYGVTGHQRFHNLLSADIELFPDCDDPDVLVQSFNSILSSVSNELCSYITRLYLSSTVFHGIMM